MFLLRRVQTLASSGVISIPTAGTLAILAERQPTIAPPPMTPTTTSGSVRLISFRVS